MRFTHPRLNAEYYTEDYLQAFGFLGLGTNVRLHKTVVIPDPSQVRLGSNIRIDAYCILTTKSLDIGAFTHIGAGVAIVGGAAFICGHFVGISHGVKIFTSNDDLDAGKLTNPLVPPDLGAQINARVHLENHSVIGANSVVLPGVHVKEGGYVGAMSLVKDDVPKFTIVGGIPTRIIKPRKRTLLKYERELREKIKF